MSVQRDHRQDALLSLASWVDGGADASAQAGAAGHAPSLAELLRRRGQGAAAGGSPAEIVAEPATVLSVPPRLATPLRTAPPPAARKGFFGRLAGLMPGRSTPRAERAKLPAAPAPEAPPARAAGPVVAHPDETRADAMAIRPEMNAAAWPPAPTSFSGPVSQPVMPAAPYLHAMPHPAAPWMPAAMPAPASAHFYWPAAPVSPPQPAHPAFMPWPAAAAPQSSGARAISAGEAERIGILAEVDAVRERLHDFAATVERVRAARRAG